MYVGAIATVLDPCPIEGLPEAWAEVIRQLRKDTNEINVVDLNERHMKSAVEGFMYCKGWSAARSKIPGWQDLELTLCDRIISTAASDA
jgi:hypothetical protein